MLASATPWGLALGYTPKAKLQHEWFHVAVEYRLNMSHDLHQGRSSCNVYENDASTIKQYFLYSKGQECTKPLFIFFFRIVFLTIIIHYPNPKQRWFRLHLHGDLMAKDHLELERLLPLASL